MLQYSPRFHFRLSPHSTVTYRYGACFCQISSCTSQHHHSNIHHSPIRQLFIWRSDIGAILKCKNKVNRLTAPYKTLLTLCSRSADQSINAHHTPSPLVPDLHTYKINTIWCVIIAKKIKMFTYLFSFAYTSMYCIPACKQMHTNTHTHICMQTHKLLCIYTQILTFFCSLITNVFKYSFLPEYSWKSGHKSIYISLQK